MGETWVSSCLPSLSYVSLPMFFCSGFGVHLFRPTLTQLQRAGLGQWVEWMFPMAGVGLPTLSEEGAENQNVGVLLPSSVLLAPWPLPPEQSPGSSAPPGAGEHQLLVVNCCI